MLVLPRQHSRRLIVLSSLSPLTVIWQGALYHTHKTKLCLLKQKLMKWMNKKKNPQQLSTFTSTYEHTVTCQKTHRENRQSTQSHELAQMFVKGVATLMFLKHRWAGNKRTFMWLWGSAYIHLISHPPPPSLSPLSASNIRTEATHTQTKISCLPLDAVFSVHITHA